MFLIHIPLLYNQEGIHRKYRHKTDHLLTQKHAFLPSLHIFQEVFHVLLRLFHLKLLRKPDEELYYPLFQDQSQG